MKTYCVKLYFSGSETFYVEAPDEDEAIDVAYDELSNMAGDLEIEVIDSESYQDDEED
jgi:hypothetical protein